MKINCKNNEIYQFIDDYSYCLIEEESVKFFKKRLLAESKL